VSKLGTIREFLQFLRQRKRFWLAPVVLLLLLIATAIVLGEGSAVAPFIYSLF